MSAALELGAWVELEDGREGQVWTEPHPDDWRVLVATGDEYVKARRESLTVIAGSGLPQPKTHPVDQAVRLVKARKRHKCGCETGHSAAGHVCIGIKPGSQYVRSVLFPGEFNASGRPRVMKLCLSCARQYTSTDPATLVVKS